MRILHISTVCHPHIQNLVEEQRKDHDVGFLHIEDGTPSSLQKNWDDEGTGFISFVYPHTNSMGFADSTLTHVLTENIRRYNPEVIHIHYFTGVDLLGIIEDAQEDGRIVVTTLHEHSVYCMNGANLTHDMRICESQYKGCLHCPTCIQKAREYGMDVGSLVKYHFHVGARLIKLSDRIHVPCPRLGRRVSRIFSCSSKVYVITHGVPRNPSPRKKPGTHTIGYAGHTGDLKGFSFLKEVISDESISGASFLLAVHSIHDGPDVESDEHVTVLRDIPPDEMYERFYSGIDVLAIPSVWEETGPIVLYEAMASGIPVVVPDILAFREKCGTSPCVFYFKNWDFSSFVEALRRALHADPPVQSFMFKDIQSYAAEVVQLYSKETYLEDYLLLNAGSACNNKCRFCLTGDHGVNHVPFDELKDIAKRYRYKFRDVILQGGEVTIRKDFIKIVTILELLGYRIILLSNARRFADRRVCRALRYSPLKVITTILGDKPHTHDSLTGVRGSYSQTMEGIQKLLMFGFEVSVKILITRDNLEEISGMMERLLSLSPAEIQIIFPTPYGRADTYFTSVVPRLSEAVPHVRAALEMCGDDAPPVRVEGFPYCILEDHLGFTRPTFKGIFEACEEHPGTLTEAWCSREEKIMTVNACMACRMRYLCEGLYKKYVAQYGDDEVKPFLS